MASWIMPPCPDAPVTLARDLGCHRRRGAQARVHAARMVVTRTTTEDCHVRNDGAMGLRRIWTISRGRLDCSRRCCRGRGGLAPAIRFISPAKARQNRNGAVASAVPSALPRGPAHFDWRWRERPALALLAGIPARDPPMRLFPRPPGHLDLPQIR